MSVLSFQSKPPYHLQQYVETHSEGEEPYRKVVVTLKKGVREWNHNSYNTKRYRANDSKREFTKNISNNINIYNLFFLVILNL